MTAMVPNVRHVRPVRPLDFPSSDPEWDMGQSGTHHRFCEALYAALRAALAPDNLVAADQYLYFDAADNGDRSKCAPDVLVKLGSPARLVNVWKTWEDGTPDLCIEVLSPSDHEKLTLDEKLRRYHTIGVSEVVAFDPLAPVGRRLRAWDRIDGDLVERVVDDERTPCVTLGLWFVLAPTADEPDLDVVLRVAHDPLGRDLLLTPAERERAEKERERAEKDAALAAAERERAEKDAALAVAERERAEKEAALVELARLRKKLEG